MCRLKIERGAYFTQILGLAAKLALSLYKKEDRQRCPYVLIFNRGYLPNDP
jgi:hypothetical protein